MGRKLESLEETYANMGKIYKTPHTVTQAQDQTLNPRAVSQQCFPVHHHAALGKSMFEKLFQLIHSACMVLHEYLCASVCFSCTFKVIVHFCLKSLFSVSWLWWKILCFQHWPTKYCCTHKNHCFFIMRCFMTIVTQFLLTTLKWFCIWTAVPYYYLTSPEDT